MINDVGNDIRPNLLEPRNITSDIIDNLNLQTTQTGLRSFIGLCNSFHGLVLNFSCMASLSTKRLRELQPKALEQLNEEKLTAL